MKIGLTYSDVLLVPRRTPLKSRSEADTTSNFTKKIILKTPLVSANMATVTEHKMAIAMAREGGIGTIHQFGSLENQVEQIKKVKKSTCYIIDNPVSISTNLTIEEASKIMHEKEVTSLLVMQGEDLVGIFTSRDYLFEDDLSKKVYEVMTPKNKLITAPYGVSLEEAKRVLHQNRIEKLPLLENNRVRGLITTQDIKKLEYWPNATRDSKGRLMVAAAVGVKDTIIKARALIEAGADCLVLDVAHAHSDFVIEKLKDIKRNFSVEVVVGNIATPQAAQDLIDAGADGLKVGIGPSPVCTTRIVAGSGVPQLTAIMDVVSVAKRYDIPVTADGGVKYSGDIAKAIGAGASTVFSGSLFAGTDESPGMILLKDGKRYKKYHGSASYESSHNRAELNGKRKIDQRLSTFVEGVSTLVDYKGPVSDVINNMTRGLRSGMSYCGSRTIKEMQQNAQFIQITSAGWSESMSRGNKVSE
jgi:IMP dehydrogenase